MTTIVPGDETNTPIIGSLFAVELGPVSGYFTEVTGLGMDIEEVAITRINEQGKSITQYIPGTVKYGTITLKRTCTADKSFWDWHHAICEGKRDYLDGAIVLYDLAGTELDRWTLLKAWPSKWSVSDLDASSDNAITEEIELQIEFLERTK